MIDNGVELVSEEDRRNLAVGVINRDLEIAGDARRRWNVSRKLPGLVSLARAMRIPVTQISAAAGLTRPTVYDLENRPSEFDSELLRIAILALLATNRFLDATGIAGLLGLATDEVLRTLSFLAANGQVAAGAAGQLTADAPFKLMANGEAALEEHADFQRGHRVEGYSFYIEVEDRHRAAVERAAQILLDSAQYNVLGAHIAHSMRMPELAFIVKADSDRDAFTIAHEIWDQVIRRAGLPHQPPRMTLALPPRSQR